MSLKGWGIALLLSPFTLGMSVILYFYIWFFTKIGKFYIKAMTFSIKAAIGLIAWPFKELFGGASWVSKTFQLFYYQGTYNIRRSKSTRSQEEQSEEEEGGFLSKIGSGLSFITRFKLRYVALFAGIVYTMGYPSIVLTVFSNPMELLTISGMLDTLPMIFILALPFIVTLIVASLSYELLGDGVVFWRVKKGTLKQAKRLGKGTAATAGAAAGAATATAQTAKNAVQGGMEAKELGETAVTTASHIQTAGDMAGIGGEAAAEGAAAEGAAAEGLMGLVSGSGIASALSTALPVVAVLAIAWFIYTLIAGIISLVLVLATWGYFIKLLPMIAGAIMPALGLGEAYGQWFGQSVGNTVGPQIGNAFAEEQRMIAQMGAKLGCALKGPQCLRQWRMNNTVRPGSEARGETYELRIDRFGLAQDRIDVAYKEKDYTLPISFLVYNTRHGLKGINARNVSYKISVEDLNNQGDSAYCTTGWKELRTQVSGDYILPGLGVSPTKSLDNLTLANCGLLQPSMGTNRVLNMEVKYDYSSQATLYFDVMSRQNRREQGVMPDFTKSETAKTPVQSYINVRSPVTYYTMENGSRSAVPFPARFGFETPGFSVRYKVDPDSIDIDDSVMTKHLENSCGGLSGKNDDDDDYQISSAAKDRIENRQNNTWFNRNINPAPIRCTFKLTRDAVQTINPTGEQLVMRIDANYTIVREDQQKSFNMVNTRCSRINCPMLVPEGYNESNPGNMYSKCTYATSVDSYGGCSVIDTSGGVNWANPTVLDGVTIRQGQTVYDWNTISSTSEINNQYVIEQPDASIVGIKDSVLERMSGNQLGSAVLLTDGRFRVAEISRTYCTENQANGDTITDYAEAFKSNNGADKIVYFQPRQTACADTDGLLESVGDLFVGEQDPSFSQFASYCEDAADQGTKSIVVSTGNSLSCYFG